MRITLHITAGIITCIAFARLKFSCGSYMGAHFSYCLLRFLGTIALFSGFRKYHRKLYPFYLLYLGVAIYWLKHDFSPSLEPLFIIAGAGLIVAAHFINLKTV